MLRTVTIFCLMFFFTVAHASEKLILILDWYANPGHAPLFVAKDKGFFEEENLNLIFIGPSNPADPPKLVAAQKADIALTYQPQFLEQVDRGLPLIRIGTLVDRPLDVMAVLKNGPIKRIEDLKGKRVGYSTSSLNSTTLKTMLNHHQLTLKEVQQINVHYDLTQALLSKNVDAIIGVMRTFEVIQMELVNQPARIFYPEKNGLPAYSELIFVIHKNNAHDPRFKKFLAALKKGVNYLKEHPEETWLLFSKNHPELNDELNRRAWFASIPYFTLQPTAFDEPEWLHFAEFMHKNGLIKIIHPINRYAIDLTKE